MFKKGCYVVNTNHGICEISDVVTMNMGSGDREYYVLVPIEESTAKVFLPVDIAEKQLYSELAFASERGIRSSLRFGRC